MSLSRRTLLKSGAAAGALMLAKPTGALAASLLPSAEFDTSRSSRLFPGTRLAHADMHNHTLYSDGAGDAAQAFASMRDAGLDVAALTDHAVGDKVVPHEECVECPSPLGLDEQEWRRTRTFADAENADGRFVAIRGFEWTASVPQTGHMNVWFSETWTDPIATGSVAAQGYGQYLQTYGGPLGALGPAVDDANRASPTNDLALAGMYEWLQAAPDRPVLGGGLDGIAGFNHPGREPGRFGYFAYQPAIADRLVSVEVFNRREDYLFEGTEVGQPSPINECLNRGWRTGLLGVTDEHGTDWGHPDGKGRTGMWVESLTRDGVKEAMLARRFFATNLRGLRLDAAATSGVPTPTGASKPGRGQGKGRPAAGDAALPASAVRMGAALTHRSGPVTFSLDIDRGSEWIGKALRVQVLQSGSVLPTVVHAEDVVVPSADQPVISFTAPVDAADGRWIVLRVTDPEREPDRRADDLYRSFGAAIAYASPFFLDPS